jgi:hypothetical protein
LSITTPPGLVRAMAVAFGALVLLDQSTIPTDASPFGSVVCDTSLSSQCVADNGSHLWYPVGLDASTDGAMSWVDLNVFDPIADVQMVKTTAFSAADLQVYDAGYGYNGFRAWVVCQAGATYGGSGPAGRWCRPQQISFNNALPGYPSEFDTDTKRRFVACHEVGHSLGLQHSTETSSCMRDVPLGYTGTRATGLTTHDIGHLNAWY